MTISFPFVLIMEVLFADKVMELEIVYELYAVIALPFKIILLEPKEPAFIGLNTPAIIARSPLCTLFGFVRIRTPAPILA